MNLLLKDLQNEIKDRKILIFVAAGVSVGATGGNPLASWTGLLNSGVDRCLALQRAYSLTLTEGWEARIREEINSGDISDLLAAAQKISDKLGYPDGSEYGRWICESFESLKITDQKVIKSIDALNSPIVTTNYDTLIEETTGRPYVSWKEPSFAQKVLKGDDRGVFHLHGVWRDPSSVVLGIQSYERLLRNEFVQTLIQSGFFFKSILFIGFGAGLRDPNFEKLREWLRRILPTSQYRHFRLVLKAELENVRQEHTSEEQIFPLSFGEEYTDLPTFLTQLKPPSSLSSIQTLTFDEQAPILDRRLSELEAKRTTLAAQEYLIELSKIAFDFATIGAKRSAWYMLNSSFREHKSELELNERVRIGLTLVEIMLNDNVADAAMFVLQELISDIDKLSPDDPSSLTFWDLQSRGFVNLAEYSDAVSSLEQTLLLAKDSDVRDRLIAELSEIHFLHGEFEKVLKDSSRR